jgi:hypothetical protein
MKTYLTILVLLTFSVLQAQVNISGTITDESGEAILGANIALLDTYDGASSDLEGKYQFSTEEKGTFTLHVSYLGYETIEELVEIGEENIEKAFIIKEAVNELNAVVITAGAFEASDKKKSVTLDPIDIVTTAGATADIAGALNTLPGTQRVGEEGQLFVRGGAAYETRTFIDGMYVQNPYGSTVTSLPSRGRFSPFLFRGTTFSTGGYSAEYGQALSSALLLNSNDLAAETMTSLSLMSVGTALAHTRRWENTSISFSGEYINVAPYTGLMPQNVQWDKPFSSTGGQLIFRHKTSETGMLKLHANLTHSDFALQMPEFSQVNQTSRLDLRNDHFYLNSSYREVLNDKWSFFAGLAYTNNLDDIAQNFDLNAREQSLQARARLSYHAFDRVKIKFGGEVLRNIFAETYQDEGQSIFKTDLTQNYSAAFVETDLIISNSLVARVGGRVEYTDLLEKANLAPRASLAYKTGLYSQVSVGYGRFYQTPGNELLRYQTDLDFEQASHYLINYQVIRAGRTFRVEGYYKDYDDLAKFPADKIWQINNDGKGYATGVDVFFRDRTTFDNANYWISYSFLDTKRDFRDFPQQSTPNFASKHNLSVVYKHWFAKWNTSMGVTYSFASRRPYNDPNEMAFNAQRTDPYHDLSMNLSYLTNFFGHFTIVHFSAANLLGLERTFGERFSSTPDEEGQYNSSPIRPTSDYNLFLGVFISFGEKHEDEERPDDF